MFNINLDEFSGISIIHTDQNVFSKKWNCIANPFVVTLIVYWKDRYTMKVIKSIWLFDLIEFYDEKKFRKRNVAHANSQR
jgi:hypothetical protein